VERWLHLALLLAVVAVVASVIALQILLPRLQPRESARETEAGVLVTGDGRVYLPLPRIRSDVLSVEEALAYRRSIREYRDEPITIEQLSQLLWAAYGVSETKYGFKTTPSAGATYPLEIYVVVKPRGVRVNETHYLEPGSYKYIPDQHALILVKRGDLSEELMYAALGQEWVGSAPVNIVIAAVFERTTRVYGERGVRYVYMEVGHAGQNIYLEATALGLGCVVIGAFYDDEVARVVGLAGSEKPMYVIPVGVPERVYRVSEQDIHNYILSRRG